METSAGGNAIPGQQLSTIALMNFVRLGKLSIGTKFNVDYDINVCIQFRFSSNASKPTPLCGNEFGARNSPYRIVRLREPAQVNKLFGTPLTLRAVISRVYCILQLDLLLSILKLYIAEYASKRVFSF